MHPNKYYKKIFIGSIFATLTIHVGAMDINTIYTLHPSIIFDDFFSPSPAINDLTSAARKGDINMIKSLLEKKADVNAIGEHEFTPLARASMEGHINIMELLLQCNADVNGKDLPLVVASDEIKDNVDAVKLLLQHNADVNGKDSAIPLLKASFWNNGNIVKVLLDNNADIAKKSLYGEWTALSRASYLGHTYVVGILLKHIKSSVNKDIPTNMLLKESLLQAGRTAAEFPKKDSLQIVTMLGRAGVDYNTTFKEAMNKDIFGVIIDHYPDNAKHMIRDIKNDANDYCDTDLTEDIYEIIYTDLEYSIPKDIVRLIARYMATNYYPDYGSQKYNPIITK